MLSLSNSAVQFKDKHFFTTAIHNEHLHEQTYEVASTWDFTKLHVKQHRCLSLRNRIDLFKTIHVNTE